MTQKVGLRHDEIQLINDHIQKIYDDGELIPLVKNTDYGLIDLNKRYEEPKIKTLKPHNNK